MANEQNLRPSWPKGVSGNPKGKPKGPRNRSTIIREMLELAALKEVSKSQKEALVGDGGEQFETQTEIDGVKKATNLSLISPHWRRGAI